MERLKKSRNINNASDYKNVYFNPEISTLSDYSNSKSFEMNPNRRKTLDDRYFKGHQLRKDQNMKGIRMGYLQLNKFRKNINENNDLSREGVLKQLKSRAIKIILDVQTKGATEG